MNNAEVIQHNGKNVLFLDIANVTPVEVIKRIKAVENKIVEFPQQSIYLVLHSANLAYNSITSSKLNEFSADFGKFIKASVVVDETFDQSQASNSKEDGPKRSKIFTNITDAIDWVTSQ